MISAILNTLFFYNKRHATLNSIPFANKIYNLKCISLIHHTNYTDQNFEKKKKKIFVKLVIIFKYKIKKINIKNQTYRET